MRKVLLSTVAGVAALLATGSMAQAADLYTPMAEPTPSTWTGFYVGGHVGYSSADYQGLWNPSEDPPLTGGQFDLDGFSGGVHLGYNWQLDNSFVFGIEGDVSGASLSDDDCHRNFAGDCQYSSTMAADIDLLASVRGRLGIAANNSLFYVTGGIAFADASFKADDSSGGVDKFDTAEDVGAVVGAGWEYKPGAQVSFRVEGLYYMFDEKTSLEDSNIDTNNFFDAGPNYMGLDDVFTIRAGVSWHPWN